MRKTIFGSSVRDLVDNVYKYYSDSGVLVGTTNDGPKHVSVIHNHGTKQIVYNYPIEYASDGSVSLSVEEQVVD